MKGTHRLIVHGLIRVNEDILILKRTKYDGDKLNVYPEYWDFPGGSVDELELPSDALIREVKEETNLDVIPVKIIKEKSNIDEKKGLVFTTLEYECNIADSNIDVKTNEEEHSEYRFINSKEIDDSMKLVPYVEEILINKN